VREVTKRQRASHPSFKYGVARSRQATVPARRGDVRDCVSIRAPVKGATASIRLLKKPIHEALAV
jgi:hypothetical protein